MSDSENLYDDVISAPEPTEVDEQNAEKFAHLIADAILRGKPFQGEDCHTCLYYLNGDADISYCWHPEIRIPVGAEWWCQWWEAAAE